MTTHATLLLVRHGAHDWLDRGLAGRLPGVALNLTGQAQAHALVHRLAGRRLDALYTSPRQRARQTLAPLARARGLELALAPGFDEIDVGDWTGMRFEDLQSDARWQAWNARRSQGWAPGGERFGDVQARVLDAVEVLQRRHAGETVAIATHADVIKLVMCAATQWPVDGLHAFEVAPASVTVMQAGTGWLRMA